MPSKANKLRHRFSRAHHNPDGLDYAWICSHCGYIILGPPCATSPPDLTRRRCPDCRSRAWIEQAIPPMDPAVFDGDQKYRFPGSFGPTPRPTVPSPFRH
jgi:DNA-directed RNA polymerase subunit RPC12/RpoP